MWIATVNASVNVNVEGEWGGGQGKLHEARRKSHKESVRAQEEVSHQGLHVQQVDEKVKWVRRVAEDGGRYRYRRRRSVMVVVVIAAATGGGRN